mmetsp:Transcript_49450/g.92544  ORF Transcript_49450/g.92544 Transcript_49450/m.92544 type:complete len:576 (+) Transcript_49450:73-1800(+)
MAFPSAWKPTPCLVLLVLIARAVASRRNPVGTLPPPVPSGAKDQTQRPDFFLERIEHSVKTFFTKREQGAVDGIIGATLLLCSKELPCTLIFLESFRSIGWPIVKDSYSQLRQQYIHARQTFTDDLPELMKARASLPRLAKQAQDARDWLSDATDSTNQLRNDIKKAEQQYRDAKQKIDRSLPSEEELIKIAETLKKEPGSWKDSHAQLKSAERAKWKVERQLQLVEAASLAKKSESERQALIESLKAEKRRTLSDLSAAQTQEADSHRAMRQAKWLALQALPNADELREARKQAQLTKEELEKRLAKAVVLQQEAQQMYSKAIALVDDTKDVTNSAEAVAKAIDLKKLNKVVQGAAAGIASCVASVASPTVRTTLVGVDVGHLFASKAVPLTEAVYDLVIDKLAEKKASALVWKQQMMGASDWLEEAAKIGSTWAGILFVQRYQNLALLCSGALLGSRLVVSAVADEIEALLERTTIDEAIGSSLGRTLLALDRLDKKEDDCIMGVKLPVDPRTTSEVLLAMMGIALQLRLKGSALPFAEAALKRPEAYLQRLAPNLKESAAFSKNLQLLKKAR